jgi:hypothetical protein
MANKFKTFTSGSVLTASDLNTYLMKQSVIQCDSSADYPSAPQIGMAVWDLNLDALLIYAGATTGWVAPWNLPWGYITRSAGTSTTNIGTTYVDLGGMSVTWSAIQNRRYRISMQAVILAPASPTTDCNVFVQFLDGGGTQKAEMVETAALTLSYTTFSLVEQYSHTSASGSTTRKAQAKVSASSNNSLVLTTPPYIQVEDIGPAGAPS